MPSSNGSLAGALAALGSSFTWAYASVRYTNVSRSIGSLRVNLIRTMVAAPIYCLVAVFLHGRSTGDLVTLPQIGWLGASVLCSYALGDILFFSAARQIGISTALAIASVYPLWSAIAGALFGAEPFGLLRGVGVLCCTLGIVALVRLSTHTPDEKRGNAAIGLLLALATSMLWAGNTFSVKRGAVGLDVWQANAIRYTIAVCLLAPNALLQRNKIPWSTTPPGGWLGMLPAIFCDCILGSILFVYGLSHADLAIGATLSSLAPLISVPFAIAMGTERWSGARALAIVVTVVGVLVLVLTS